MADFPPALILGKEDSKDRTQSPDDPAQKHTTDGGYTVTRQRYTRRPRRTFTTGFTDLSQAEMESLETFWDTFGGGSASFTWIDPTTEVTLTVRFDGKYTATYRGMGGNHRWDVKNVLLKEV